jgi:pentatricopeptide repeat protein
LYSKEHLSTQVDTTSSGSAVVYYTALISMYTKCGYPEKAVEVYYEMLQRKAQPGLVTYICVFTACGAMGPSGLEVGRQLCNNILQEDISADTSLENSMLSMLVKCGKPLEALTRWKTLQTNNSFSASTVTYICVLAACADLGATAITHGAKIHSLLTENELKQEDVMAALLNMYARCGQPLTSLELWKSFVLDTCPSSPAVYTAIFTACATLRTTEALAVGSVARNMMNKAGITANVITNTAMIQMYARCGDPDSALSLWSSQLRSQPLSGDTGKSDKIRIVSVLSVCSTLQNNAALQIGRQLARIVDSSPGLRDDIMVITALIGMYERCGEAETAITLWKDVALRKIRPTSVTYPGKKTTKVRGLQFYGY